MIHWNKYEPKVIVQKQNRYLDFLINPSFSRNNYLLFYHFKIMVLEQITRDIIFHM